jgi:hypothetical protein
MTAAPRRSEHRREAFGSPAPARSSALTAALAALEERCPDHIDAGRWHRAVEDGRRFLAAWGDQAVALGWTADDLFGLHDPPTPPHPSYRRLSRLDQAGLMWLVRGRQVIAITAGVAVIAISNGGSLSFYKSALVAEGRARA